MPSSVTSNEKSATSPSIEGDIPSITQDQIDERRLLLKLDWRLLPIVTLLYLWSFLDRTNIGEPFISSLNFVSLSLYRQCKDRRPHGRSQSSRLEVQYLFCSLLRLLLCVRSPEQHGSQESPT